MKRHGYKHAAKVCALLLAATLLGGCTGGASIEGLLSPPKLSEEQNDIYQAVLNVIGKDISLKYPKSGDYRSAFVVTDVDSEPTNEAMVFYNAKGAAGESSLRINFLDQQDGKWVSVYDIAALGTEVERVILDNLGDGETSVIITYSALNSTEKAVSVLKFADGTPVEVYRSSYSFLDFIDVNGDGGKEMTVISYDSATELSSISLHGWFSEGFVTYCNTYLSVGAAEFGKVTFGGFDAYGGKALYVDYFLGDSLYGTDVLLLRGTNLRLIAPSTQIRRRSNSSTPVVYCADADADGIAEIPITSPMRGYEELTKPEQLYTFSWYGINASGVMTKKSSSFISPKGDYYLNIPSRWDGLITATVSAEGEVVFWRAAPLNELSARLLSIKSSSASAETPEGFVYYMSNAEGSINYSIKQGDSGDSLLLTESELETCLHASP